MLFKFYKLLQILQFIITSKDLRNDIKQKMTKMYQNNLLHQDEAILQLIFNIVLSRKPGKKKESCSFEKYTMFGNLHENIASLSERQYNEIQNGWNQ